MIQFDLHPVYNPRGAEDERLHGILFPNGSVSFRVEGKTYSDFSSFYEENVKGKQRFVRWLDFETHSWSPITSLLLSLSPYPCFFRRVPADEVWEYNGLLGITFTQTVDDFPSRKIELYVCLSPNSLSDGGYVEEPFDVGTHTFSTPEETVAFVVDYVKREVHLP